MNNTLLKLNNEYVKLYITLNSNLPELLKNSGSLIVYHNDKANNNQEISDTILTETSNDDNNEIIEINRLENLYTNNNNNLGTNYLYLGNEVIASGWGFDNEKQKDFVIENLNIIPERINSIIDVLNKIIGKSKQQLYVSKEGDLGSYDELYIASDHFEFDDNINLNKSNDSTNEGIKISDLPKLLYKAKYKQEEIINIQYLISSITFNGKTKEYNNDYDYIDNNNKYFYVPYNCDLTYKIIIKYIANDSGQVKSIKFNNDDIDSEYITSGITVNNSITYNIITINKRITNVTDIINPIIDITFYKTNSAKYKNYLYLENLYSIEHIIPEHTVRLNSLFNSYKIVPKDVLYNKHTLLSKGISDSYSSNSNTYDYIGMKEDFNIRSLSDFNNNLIIDENKILIKDVINNNEEKRYLLIYEIPVSYNINKIILHSNDGLTHKNILGNFKIYNKYVNNKPINYCNIIYTLININNGSYYIEFNFTKNNIKNNEYINNNFNNINLLNEDVINNTYYLTTDDYDAGYWFNGNNNYFLDALNDILGINKDDSNQNSEYNKFKNRFYSIAGDALNKVLS